ncbi:MAG: hypothetical protein LUQ29_12975 [Methylococcaceae bacterium]|nr:hypothetical protein [Methylococcaceae bacterium]
MSTSEAKGIRFALPTQTLHIESLPEEKSSQPVSVQANTANKYSTTTQGALQPLSHEQP